MLACVGITAWFLVQAFLNIGVVIGLLPITGVPLPFISFGGSSLLVTMCAAGFLLNVARHPRTRQPSLVTFALVAGGGTAGHLLPGLAVAEALVARGHERSSIHFVGSDRGRRGRARARRPASASTSSPVGASSAG